MSQAEIEAEDDEWEPGDPLHHTRSYGGYLFNFREDSTSENCNCNDAARWPSPRFGDRLSDHDELEEFIDEWRAWQILIVGGRGD